jgi:hypothetical protein
LDIDLKDLVQAAQGYDNWTITAGNGSSGQARSTTAGN